MPSPVEPIPLPRGWPRWRSLAWLTLGCTAVAAVSLLPALLGFGAGCGFYLLTGASCPGCGMTRAGEALLHGDLAASLAHHPLGLLLVALVLVAFVAALREGITGLPVFRGLLDRLGTRVAIAFLALLFIVWFVRVVAVPRWAPDPVRKGSVAERVLPG